VPLCIPCHRERHDVGRGEFERRRGIDLRSIAAALHEALSKTEAARLEDTTQRAEQT
jgi:hypothetical protein